MTLKDVLDKEAGVTPMKIVCTHIFRSGRRCNREPVDGDEQLLCVLHGGDMELATESVRRRLMNLQTTAIGALEELIVFGDDKTRVSVAVAVFDRTGLGPKSVLSVRTEDGDDTSQLTDDQIEQELAQLHAKAAAESKRRQEDALMEEEPSASGTVAH